MNNVTDQITLTGRGGLRHRFWGDYSAMVWIRFDSPDQAAAALPFLNQGSPGQQTIREANGSVYLYSGLWSQSTSYPETVGIHVDSDGLEVIKEHLQKFGADTKAMDNCVASIDYGQDWTVSIPIPDVETLPLPGFEN